MPLVVPSFHCRPQAWAPNVLVSKTLGTSVISWRSWSKRGVLVVKVAFQAPRSSNCPEHAARHHAKPEGVI